MRENKPVQLEIFTPSTSSETKKRGSPFLEYLWGYEKTILILIGILAVGVLSFSLGVEKGKRIARRDAIKDSYTGSPVSVKPAQPAVQPVRRIEIQPAQAAVNTAPRTVLAARAVPQARAAVATKPLKLSGQTGSFTIQVASYKSKKSADTQAQVFKKKGITAMVLTKGEYLVLCVGRFPSQDEARAALKELQKQYKGCYIRRL
ncbi:MAG: SPOR domain-containing protein [Candidatus Omnitrophica bacterium]|nr:SPOR domain-containing protein [Candidatus Omnitrophota bacterium]